MPPNGARFARAALLLKKLPRKFRLTTLDSCRLATRCRSQAGRKACTFELEATLSNTSGLGVARARPKSSKDFHFGRLSRTSAIFAASLMRESEAFIAPNIQKRSRC